MWQSLNWKCSKNCINYSGTDNETNLRVFFKLAHQQGASKYTGHYEIKNCACTWIKIQNISKSWFITFLTGQQWYQRRWFRFGRKRGTRKNPWPREGRRQEAEGGRGRQGSPRHSHDASNHRGPRGMPEEGYWLVIPAQEHPLPRSWYSRFRNRSID